MRLKDTGASAGVVVPTARSAKLWPLRSSPSGQLALKAPAASAVTVKGAWPASASAVPSACVTCSVTTSSAANPDPVIATLSPAKYPVLSLRTAGGRVCASNPPIRPTYRLTPVQKRAVKIDTPTTRRMGDLHRFDRVPVQNRPLRPQLQHIAAHAILHGRALRAVAQYR